MASKAKDKRELARAKRRSRYGLVKVKEGQEVGFISRQDKNGWSLGLTIGKLTYWLKHVRFASDKEVKRVLKSGIMLVHLKGESK